jgi:DNA-binding GntR family transcriptional regulator
VLDPTLRVLNTLLLALEGEPGLQVSLSTLELSDRTGLGPQPIRAVVEQLHHRGYLALDDQTVTVRDRAPLEALRDLLGLKEDVRNGLGCRSTDTPS